MSPTTSAGISDVGVAAGSPAASMSMADSKASPSIGPCSRIALPVSRSCSRSDGVAVTPLFVASAVWVRIAASGRSLAMHCSMAGVRAGWRRSSGKPWPSLCVWT